MVPTQEPGSVVPRFDPAFRPLLRDFDLALLDEDEAPIFGIWADLRLAYANRALAALEVVAGVTAMVQGLPIGGSVAPALGEPLADWARELLRGPRRLSPEAVVYPGSSPLLQESQLSAFPLSGAGLLLVHSLPREAPRQQPARQPEPSEAGYRNADGFVVQCSHCRRFRSPGVEDRWDWSDAWFAQAPRQTSHGLCKVCVAIHYPPWAFVVRPVEMGDPSHGE